jgi:RNA polymerase sigma-70 factor (ECF subfamily)
MMMKEEFFLLQKLNENDMSAMEVLYIRYAPQVKSFVSAILKDSADADDIVQDIFLRIWEDRHVVSQAKSFKAYLFTMTRNVVYNKLKHDRVHDRYVGLESKRTSQDEIEERIMTKDLLDQIKEEMERLTEQQRIIYELNRDEDMTYKQIAEKLGISPKTVQYHISNVLAKLKKLL